MYVVYTYSYTLTCRQHCYIVVCRPILAVIADIEPSTSASLSLSCSRSLSSDELIVFP